MIVRRHEAPQVRASVLPVRVTGRPVVRVGNCSVDGGLKAWFGNQCAAFDVAEHQGAAGGEAAVADWYDVLYGQIQEQGGDEAVEDDHIDGIDLFKGLDI